MTCAGHPIYWEVHILTGCLTLKCCALGDNVPSDIRFEVQML